MRDFGAYVHVPFCAARCDYCAFATWTDRAHLVDRYVDAVGREIDRAVAGGLPPASSVFFGGGTPSLLPADALVGLLARLPRQADAEVTVECNPDDLTAAAAATYAAGGVNRLSFGVQSLVDHVLVALGRTHRRVHVEQALGFAREAGIENLSVDLIYGGAGETLEDWRTTLEAAVALGTAHVSAYALTVEPGTPLAEDEARHPDDDDQADKYLLTEQVLGSAGLAWYEISNFARPGFASRHNQLYWHQGDYRGFGCAAHSHEGGRRWWNVRTPERYLAAIDDDRSAEAGAEELDAETRRLEGLQLAVRTTDGVPVEAVPLDEPGGVPGELVDVRDGRARLTVRGRLLANEVAIRLR